MTKKMVLVERSRIDGGPLHWDITLDDLHKRIAELDGALRKIAHMKPEPIGDTGFTVGPQALLDACQRVARAALKG